MLTEIIGFTIMGAFVCYLAPLTFRAALSLLMLD